MSAGDEAWNPDGAIRPTVALVAAVVAVLGAQHAAGARTPLSVHLVGRTPAALTVDGCTIHARAPLVLDPVAVVVVVGVAGVRSRWAH